MDKTGASLRAHHVGCFFALQWLLDRNKAAMGGIEAFYSRTRMEGIDAGSPGNFPPDKRDKWHRASPAFQGFPDPYSTVVSNTGGCQPEVLPGHAGNGKALESARTMAPSRSISITSSDARVCELRESGGGLRPGHRAAGVPNAAQWASHSPDAKGQIILADNSYADAAALRGDRPTSPGCQVFLPDRDRAFWPLAVTGGGPGWPRPSN